MRSWVICWLQFLTYTLDHRIHGYPIDGLRVCEDLEGNKWLRGCCAVRWGGLHTQSFSSRFFRLFLPRFTHAGVSPSSWVSPTLCPSLGLPAQCSLCLLPYTQSVFYIGVFLLLRSSTPVAKWHQLRGSVSLGLTGSQREGCGLGLRPANGSGALAGTMGPWGSSHYWLCWTLVRSVIVLNVVVCTFLGSWHVT